MSAITQQQQNLQAKVAWECLIAEMMEDAVLSEKYFAITDADDYVKVPAAKKIEVKKKEEKEDDKNKEIEKEKEEEEAVDFGTESDSVVSKSKTEWPVSKKSNEILSAEVVNGKQVQLVNIGNRTATIRNMLSKLTRPVFTARTKVAAITAEGEEKGGGGGGGEKNEGDEEKLKGMEEKKIDGNGNKVGIENEAEEDTEAKD